MTGLDTVAVRQIDMAYGCIWSSPAIAHADWPATKLTKKTGLPYCRHWWAPSVCPYAELYIRALMHRTQLCIGPDAAGLLAGAFAQIIGPHPLHNHSVFKNANSESGAL